MDDAGCCCLGIRGKLAEGIMMHPPVVAARCVAIAAGRRGGETALRLFPRAALLKGVVVLLALLLLLKQ